MVRTVMGRVNRPIKASTALLPPYGLTGGGTLPYGTLTRTGAGATYVDPYGTVQPAAVNVARINNSQLVGTNLIRNPRMTGATVGSTMSSATGWGGSSTATGMTALVVGKGVLTTGIAAGMDYVDVQIIGPNTSATTLIWQLYPQQTGPFVPAVQGETFTLSAYMQVIAGTVPQTTAPVTPGFDEKIAGAHNAYNFTATGLVGTLSTTMQRISRPTTVAAPGIDAVQPGWWFNCTPTTTYVDVTIRIAGPQFEKASVATVYATPSPGTLEVSADYVQPRLLIEEGRTNGVRNPRAEGSVNGTPGTNPTNWTNNLTGSGMTGSVVATGTESGIPYIDYRIAGTATGNIFPSIWVEANNVIASVVGNQRALTMYLRLVAGSWANVANVGLGGYEYSAVPAFLASNSTVVAFPTVAPLVTQRTAYNATMLQATTAFWQPFFALSILSGAVVDVTFRIGAPQDESGVNSTSLILPPVGVPAATARGNDIYNIPISTIFKYGTPVINLALQSQTFDNATWVKTATTVTPDVITAPDSLVTADKVIETAVNSPHLVRQSYAFAPSTQYTASVYAKAAERTAFTFLVFDNSGNIASWSVNLSTGAIQIAGASLPGATATIQSLGASWYRIAVTFTTTAAPSGSYVDYRLSDVYPSGGTGATYLGDGVSGIYLWGAQLETGPAASAYSTTTTVASTARTKLAAGTLVVRSRLFYTPPTGAIYGIFTLSDGTANSRIGMRYTPTAIASVLITNLVSSTGPTGMASVPQPATTYTQGLSWDDTGVTSVVNGVGASTAVNVPMPTGVTTLHIGQGTAGGFILVGEVDYVTYYPYRMNSTQLAAVTA